MKILVCLFAILLLIVPKAYTENKSVIIVGNKIILQSDIQAKISEIGDSKKAVEELIIETMLVFQAEKEGITVTPKEVEDEIKRIKQSFADEEAFLQYLSKRNISAAAFRQSVENKIKINHLIRKNVINNIEIRQSEIMAVMKELESQAKYSYKFMIKWCDTEEEGKMFVSGFDSTKAAEMSMVEWIQQDEMLPEILQEIKKIKEGELTAPFKVNDRYLVVFLKGIKQDKQNDIKELFARARKSIYQKKFNEQFDLYVKKLQSSIPVFYSE